MIPLGTPKQRYEGGVYSSPLEKSVSAQTDDLQPGDTLLLHPEGSSLENPAQHATYTPNSDYSIGRKEATSGIFFADMEIDDNQPQPVAIKPLATSVRVDEEIRLANRLNQLGLDSHNNLSGPPVTFVPIGTHRTPDGRVCTVTRYEHGVQSFDNFFWDPEVKPSEGDIRFALTNAAAALVFLHANGLVHRDYSAKNAAADTRGSRVIDISSMQKVRGTDPSEAMRVVEDIRSFINSLNRIHRLPEPGAVTETQVEDHFMEYYRGCIDDMFQPPLAEAIHISLRGLKVSSALENPGRVSFRLW